MKEEDRFIKELGLIEDIFVESRISSLNLVRLSMTLIHTGVSINSNHCKKDQVKPAKANERFRMGFCQKTWN